MLKGLNVIKTTMSNRQNSIKLWKQLKLLHGLQNHRLLSRKALENALYFPYEGWRTFHTLEIVLISNPVNKEASEARGTEIEAINALEIEWDVFETKRFMLHKVKKITFACTH